MVNPETQRSHIEGVEQDTQLLGHPFTHSDVYKSSEYPIGQLVQTEGLSELQVRQLDICEH